MLRILVLVLITTVQPSVHFCDSFFDPLKVTTLNILAMWYVDTEFNPFVLYPEDDRGSAVLQYARHALHSFIYRVLSSYTASKVFFLGGEGGGGQWKYLRGRT